LVILASAILAEGATTLTRYFAHEAVEDADGVIAPWYKGQNGQCDFRVRIAAETLKRYPWVTTDRAAGTAPEYTFNSTWRIDPDGTITIPPYRSNWTDGDRGQMCARTLHAWVEYYRYTGDPAAIAHIEAVANNLVDHSQTDANHPWPNFLISVPVMGKPYYQADPAGWIQLDIVGEAADALLRAYQLVGNERWLHAVQHWGDVLAEKCNHQPGAAPWGRYANPEMVKPEMRRSGNVLTGGVVYLLAMLDGLIRLGYTGTNDEIIAARDAARAYLADTLLPAWTTCDSWGRNYWDWEDPVQSQTTTDWVARYLMANKDHFPNWKNDVRNILTLFLNHTSVNPNSRGEVYNGAWAFPESSSCCGTTLVWGPMELALDFAQYGFEANSEWASEMARRQQIFATYDALETGVVKDRIEGAVGAAGGWLKAAHPSALEWVLLTMGWMPETLGANRENHIMRSSAVVNSVVYGKGKITYSTFDAPENTIDVLRLAFEPRTITSDDKVLARRRDLSANGYVIEPLSNRDSIVSIRHDGQTNIVVEGNDPQQVSDDTQLKYSGQWTTIQQKPASGGSIHTASAAEASMYYSFRGNQLRLIGSVSPGGGLADVYIDNVKQLCGIDFWNPKELHQQVVYYRNGLSNDRHTVKIVAQGKSNPLSQGSRINVDAVQYSAAEGANDYGEGGGPTHAQRMIFGYTSRTNYVDNQGHAWRPGTEFVVRTGARTDAVAKTWWTMRQAVIITGTTDPELYQYGIHAPDFTVNVTVGPGHYDVRLKFAETQYHHANQRSMTIYINDQPAVENLDVLAKAGKANKAVDLVFSNIQPKNGVIEIRFQGNLIDDCSGEAMIQAIEVGPVDGNAGTIPTPAKMSH
jgi:hypothetical protein